MYDLPDYLPGTPPMYGVKQENCSSPQGLDLYIPLDFSESGISDFSGYTLEAILKDDKLSDAVVWFGHTTDGGLVLVDTTYYAYISLAQAITIPAGLYYLAVTAELTGDGAAAPVSNKTLLYEQEVSLRNTAASVNLYTTDQAVSFTITPSPADS